MTSVCTLIATWRSVPGYDIVVAMNRDESAARPADPPALLEGDPPVVAPRDRKAGGTWLGASGTGLVVGLSNRRGRNSTAAPSRGRLVLEALRRPSVAAVDVFLQAEVRAQEYNFWNLVALSRQEVRFFSYDGAMHLARGHEGLNVLTNDGGNVSTDPKVVLVQDLLAKSARAGIDGVTRGLQATLRRHATADGPAICVHGPGYGTVSSTILALSDADPGENVLLFADGPPCSTPFRDYGEVVRRLPSPA